MISNCARFWVETSSRWSACALKYARTLVPTTIDNNEVKSTNELAVDKKLLPVTDDWRVLVHVDEDVISSTLRKPSLLMDAALSHQIRSQ